MASYILTIDPDTLAALKALRHEKPPTQIDLSHVTEADITRRLQAIQSASTPA